MSELIGVWVNCASEEEATRIAEEAVKRRLAACSNIHAPIVSSYHWKGLVENNREVPLLLKTRPSLFGHPMGVLPRVLGSFECPSPRIQAPI
jgi:periplasmic divalent cation tolerance protein